MLFILALVCLAVLGISFVCSLTEAILLSLNPLALKLQEKQGISAATRWLAMKNHIERPVAAILVFNTLAGTGLATLAGALFIGEFGGHWLWIFSLVMSAAVLLIGEMAPKILGVHHAEKLAPRVIGPLTWMLRICHPLVVVIEKFGRAIRDRTSTIKSSSDQIMDIITLVQAARAEQLLHTREEIIIIHAATLSGRRVKTAMVPRAAVKVFHSGKTLLENVQSAGPKLHRSYPVSATGELEDITGYVRVRELFVQNLTDPTKADWPQLIRPALRINGKASLTQLLALFLENKEIAALVEGPNNELIGWITLDDVTQVLMGARL